jgi:hypothetical protein
MSACAAVGRTDVREAGSNSIPGLALSKRCGIASKPDPCDSWVSSPPAAALLDRR